MRPPGTIALTLGIGLALFGLWAGAVGAAYAAEVIARSDWSDLFYGLFALFRSGVLVLIGGVAALWGMFRLIAARR